MRGDVRKLKCEGDIEEEPHPPAENGQNINRQGRWGQTRVNGRRHQNWSVEESDYSLKSNDPFLGKSDVWKDDAINEDTQRWPSDDSYCVRRSSTLEEREQEDQKRSLKNRREHIHREMGRSFEGSKNRSRSPVSELKWKSYEQSERSRSGSTGSSHTHRNSTSEQWRKVSHSRFLHHDDRHYMDRGLSENDYAKTSESRPSFGGVSRERTNNWSPNRIQSLSQSLLQNFKWEQSDRSLSESGEASQPCRSFATDSNSGYLRQGDKRYKDKIHREIKSAESLESGDEYGRAFRNDEESTYSRRDRLWSNTFHNEDERSYGFRQKRDQSSSTLCKYHAMRKCRNGDKCSLSHDVPEHSKDKGQSKNEKRGHAMDEDIKLWTGPWDNIVTVSDTARSTGWGKWETGNRNCANAVDTKSPEDKMESKCQSWGGKRVVTSIDDTKKWNWPLCDDSSAISKNCGQDSTNQTPGDVYFRSNKNSSSKHGYKPESRESGGTLCTDLESGKCGDGDRCRFSHGGSTHEKEKWQSRDGKWGNTSDDGKKLWNGPTWDDVSTGSQAAKSTGWGNIDGRDIHTTVLDTISNQSKVGKDLNIENKSRDSLVLTDKVAPSNEHGSLEMPSGRGGAIMNVPESIVVETPSVKEDPGSLWATSQSLKLDDTNDSKNLWNGPIWNDIKVSSDASKSRRQGNSDVGELGTEKVVAEGSTYHRMGHSSNDTSDTRYLQSNRSGHSNHRLESHKNGDTICNYFARGKCNDGYRCRFSHGDSPRKKLKRQSLDDKMENVSDSSKKVWNGPTWDDVSYASRTAKSIGWGNIDGGDVKVTDPLAASSNWNRVDHCLDSENSSLDSSILKDKAAWSNEHESFTRPSGTGGAIVDVPKSVTVETAYVKKYRQSIRVPAESEKIGKHGNSDVEKITDQIVTEESTMHRTGHRFNDTSGAINVRSTRNSGSPESHKNGDTLSKYNAREKCDDGDRYRFSHGDSTRKKSKSQSWDGKWEIVSDNGKKSWNGPRWDDVSIGSQAAKLAGWGTSDAKDSANSKSNRLPHDLDDRNVSPGSRVLRDKRNVPNSAVAKKDSFQEPRSMRAPFQSQTLNGTNDSKNLWKGPTLNDTTVPSDSSKWDMQGKMKGYGKMVSEEYTYHKQGHNLNDTSANMYSGKNQRKCNSYECDDTVCKYLTTGKCRDGDRCRASHGTSSLRKSKFMSRDCKLENDSDTGKKLWNAPTWDDASTVSQTAKSTGWGNSDDNIKLSGTGVSDSTSKQLGNYLNAEILKDNNAKRDEFAKVSVYEASQPISLACFQSRKTDKIDLAYSVDVMPETVTSHRIAHSTERRSSEKQVKFADEIIHTILTTKSIKQDGGDNKVSVNVTGFSSDPVQQNQSPKRPMNSISEQENNDNIKIRGLEENEVPLENRYSDSTVKGDDNEMLLLRNALIEFVKEILVPTWKEGRISKDVYKTIVKKVADKVCSTIKGNHIPKTRESVDHYLSSSRPNITKLVQAYVEIYPKI